MVTYLTDMQVGVTAYKGAVSVLAVGVYCPWDSQKLTA